MGVGLGLGVPKRCIRAHTASGSGAANPEGENPTCLLDTHAQSTPSRKWEKPREQGSIGPGGGGARGGQQPSVNRPQQALLVKRDK